MLSSTEVEMDSPNVQLTTTDSMMATKQIDNKDSKTSTTTTSQTLSPEGSITSTVSSQESANGKKRRHSDIQEELDGSSLLDTKKQETVPIKLSKAPTIIDRHPGENDLNIIDDEANEVLEEIKRSIKQAEIAMEQQDDKELITQLLDSLIKAKSLILKLNLNKNLFKFQITSELEQNNIEKQILLRNLETFQTNLNSLVIDNNNLSNKNMKLIKYYKNLKYGKFKDLKQKNLQLLKELESFKQPSAPSSAGSSGRSSIAQQSGENHMLNTLGMLASQVLANEEPQKDGNLPPTFGSFKSTSQDEEDAQ